MFKAVYGYAYLSFYLFNPSSILRCNLHDMLSFTRWGVISHICQPCSQLQQQTELNLRDRVWWGAALTCLICGYIYRHILPGSWAQVGYSVHCLNLKGIVCVSK